MSCDLSVLKTAACESGIGKVQDPILLQQIIAQLLCEISQGGGGGGVPSGAIMGWYGTIATIPSGWVLCNGSNGTPDLRNRFVVGADGDHDGQAQTTLTGGPSKTGGVVNHTHDVNDPGHFHSLAAADSAQFELDGATIPAAETDSATTGITLVEADSVPPYYALAYIMKT